MKLKRKFTSDSKRGLYTRRSTGADENIPIEKQRQQNGLKYPKPSIGYAELAELVKVNHHHSHKPISYSKN